jgi:hypothetical protein
MTMSELPASLAGRYLLVNACQEHLFDLRNKYLSGENRMSNKETKKGISVNDVEAPFIDSEIESWCEVPEEGSDAKSADDLVIDAWCKDSRSNNKHNESFKK